jgi:endonuclease YncB( thermonuclease family)
MVNEEMIKAKMAKEYTFITPYKYQNRFKKLEE